MPLTYFSQLQKLPSLSIYGVELFRKIDSFLNENQAMKDEAIEHLITFFNVVNKLGASDIDFGARGVKRKIWLRVEGNKKPAKEIAEYDTLEVAAIILCCLNDKQKEYLFEHKNIDFSLSIPLENVEKPARFRGDAYIEQNELAVNFRRINPFIMDIHQLGFAEPVIKRMNLHYEKFGLTLVTGITGSGKSTTLDAIIDMNNKMNEGHIVILGHPIEYIHDSEKCLVRHRDVGPDVESFQHGTIEALRQDPDIIVVGEIRDALTIGALLEITDSGHKTFSTLHTSSAVDSIHRIIAEFPPIEQDRIRERLADTLSVIISQKLVPTIDGKRALAKEVLSVNNSIRAAIVNKNISEIYQMINEGSKEGMITMEQDLANLVLQRQISRDTAMNFANNKIRMQQILSYL
jgi:twitching motility protein PilT